jgi:hypothetical protein
MPQPDGQTKQTNYLPSYIGVGKSSLFSMFSNKIGFCVRMKFFFSQVNGIVRFDGLNLFS